MRAGPDIAVAVDRKASDKVARRTRRGVERLDPLAIDLLHSGVETHPQRAVVVFRQRAHARAHAPGARYRAERSATAFVQPTPSSHE